MHQHNKLIAFSAHRLGGEPVPDDVKILLDHAQDLFDRSGIELNWDAGWAPWLDTGYLTQTDWTSTDIIANVRAIAKVCEHVAFIAAHEDAEYYGYWRGLDMRPIANAPLILLNNEGQLQLCGKTFAEAVLSRTYSEDRFSEMRDWLQSLGISGLPQTRADLDYSQAEPSPPELHQQFFYQHEVQDR